MGCARSTMVLPLSAIAVMRDLAGSSENCAIQSREAASFQWTVAESAVESTWMAPEPDRAISKGTGVAASIAGPKRKKMSDAFIDDSYALYYRSLSAGLRAQGCASV